MRRQRGVIGDTQTQIVRDWLDGEAELVGIIRGRAQLDEDGLRDKLLGYLFPVLPHRRGTHGRLIWSALEIVDWAEIHDIVYGG